jgi:glycosyltransferase involved in cell wall biosynthesis
VSFARSAFRDSAELERPSVVIGSSPHLLAALAGSRMARRWKVPFVLEVRDLWPESLMAAGGRRGVAYVVLDLLARYLYRRADRIVYLAPGTHRYLAERRAVPEDRLVYVPNGVDPDAFPPVERGGRSTFTLVYTGAHGPANALDVVLAAARLLADRDGIRFVLVGDGPAKEALVRKSHDERLNNVEFRDPVPKSEIAEVLASADAGLMVLRDTPLFAFGVSPNKLFDYMGAGLPIVCNVPGVVAEMVKEAGAGVQADAGSARSLADAILHLSSRSEADRRAMGRSAREWVAREHGRRGLGARLHQALTAVVGG